MRLGHSPLSLDYLEWVGEKLEKLCSPAKGDSAEQRSYVVQADNSMKRFLPEQIRFSCSPILRVPKQAQIKQSAACAVFAPTHAWCLGF